MKYTKYAKRESENFKAICLVDNNELTKQRWFVKFINKVYLGRHFVLIRSSWRILPYLVGLLWQTLLSQISLLGGTLLVQTGLPEQTLLAPANVWINVQCQTQSMFGDTVYSCYCKLTLVTSHDGG